MIAICNALLKSEKSSQQAELITSQTTRASNWNCHDGCCQIFSRLFNKHFQRNPQPRKLHGNKNPIPDTSSFNVSLLIRPREWTEASNKPQRDNVSIQRFVIREQ